MIGPLVRMELRLRGPALAAALALAAGGPFVAEAVLAELGRGARPPAGYTLASAGAFADVLALALAVLAICTVHDAFTRQRQRQTDTFLAGLPLTPRAVFTARALSCAAVVFLVPLVRHPLALLGHALWGDWPVGLLQDVAWPLFLGDLLRAAVTLGLALSVAQARRAGWLIAAVVLLGLRLLTLQELLPPSCDLLAFAGPTPLHPGPTFPSAVVWLGVALAAVALGYRLFADGADGPGELDRVLRRGLLARLSNGLTLLLIAALPLSILTPAVDLGPPTVCYPGARVTANTERYRFTFPARLARQARPLIDEADAIHARVTKLLGQSGGEGDVIEIELTDVEDSSPSRLNLAGTPKYELARSTCAEQVRRATGGRLASASRMYQTFEEGLCRSVAWRATDGDPFWSRFQAAIHHSRRPLRIDEVFDRNELVRHRGAEVGPVLGEAFVEAIVRERGTEAIPRLLEAVREGRHASPRSGEAAFERWKELLAKANLTPGPLEERLLAVIEDEILADPRAHIALPRLRVILEIQEKPIGWRVVAVPDKDVPEGWYVICRLRRNPPDSPEETPLRPQRLGPDQTGCSAFFLRASPFQGPPWIQVGLHPIAPPPLCGPLWEEWVSPDGRP